MRTPVHWPPEVSPVTDPEILDAELKRVLSRARRAHADYIGALNRRDQLTADLRRVTLGLHEQEALLDGLESRANQLLRELGEPPLKHMKGTVNG